MSAIVEVKHLRKHYGSVAAVEDVSFDVQPGEIFGIMGPNGAGKTTTIECIQGLRDPDEGAIEILGIDALRHRGQLRGKIGSQLQESALPDRMKVWEALDLFASLGQSSTDYRALMHQWGLAGKARTSFANLSGGQRQRLFVALALVNNPQLVFLDELTQGLDPEARRVAWDLIREVREGGATVVLVTHYMDEAEQLCDRIAIINNGRVIACAPPQALIAESTQGIRVLFSSDDMDLSCLNAIEGVRAVTRNQSRVEVTGSGPVLALVAAALVSRGIVPSDLRTVQPGLEEVYFELVRNGATRTEDEGAASA